MGFDHLRYFNHLANVLSYTKAAEDLYIAQPTLSMAIKRMEKELGVQLLCRTKGGGKVELTEAGKVFHEYTSLALKNYDTALRLAKEAQGEMSSTLRVGTIYAMQGRLWSDAMQSFMSECPFQPRVVIDQAYSVDLVERLRRGDLDVAFVARVPGDEGFNRVLVWSQPLVLAVHKSHPWAKRSSVDVDELAGRGILTYTSGSPAFESLKNGLPLEEMGFRHRYDDEITLSGMVSSNKENMAVFIYSFLVEAFPDVVCLPIIGIPSDFHKIYLTSNRETKPKVVDDFIDFMAAYRFPNIQDLKAMQLAVGA